MSKKLKVTDLPDFDFSEHLDSEQAISEYLNAIVEDGDAALLAAALGDIAKARGMTEIALGRVLGGKHCIRHCARGRSRASTPSLASARRLA